MRLSLQLVSLSLFGLSSCAAIPDVPGCVELEPTVGYCVHTLSAKEFLVDKDHPFEGKDWPTLKASSLIIPPKSYAALKAYLMKKCAQREDCDLEEQEALPGEEALRKLDKRR